MSKERLIWADSIKGWLALIVIFGHALQFGVAKFGEDYVWNLIYSAHMPAFFAISGFLSYRSNTSYGSWWKSIFRRVKQLLLPFIVWSLIDFCTHDYDWDHLLRYILYPDCMYWFLWTLFFIYLAFTLIVHLSRKYSIREDVPIIVFCLLLVMAMVFFNYRKFGFQFFSYYFLFYSMGYFIRKYSLLIKKKAILAVLLLTWLFLAYYWRMDSAPTFVPSDSIIPQSLWLYSYRFIAATVGVFVLLSFAAKDFNNYGSDSRIVKLGTYSLGSYVVQLLIIPWVISIVRYVFVGVSDVSIVLVSFCITTVLSVATICLLNKNKYTALIFLGKINK